jgi:PAS domain S-box-containing protein
VTFIRGDVPIFERSAFSDDTRELIWTGDSDATWRTLSEAMPNLAWMSSPDGKLLWFNDRWREYTGLDSESSIARQGTDWGGLIHPDDFRAVIDGWREALSREKLYEIESRIRRSDGAYRWFLTRGVPVRDATGKLVRWFGTCTDIEDRKRAEERLRLLARIHEAVGTPSELRRTLDQLAGVAVPTIAEWCALFLLLPDGKLEPMAIAHEDPKMMALAWQTASATVGQPGARAKELLQTHRALYLPTMPPRWLEHIPDEALRAALGRLSLGSMIVAPLVTQGRGIGLLYLAAGTTRPALDSDDLQIAELLADRAAAAIDNALSHERMRIAAEASDALQGSLELERRLDRLLAIAVPRLATWAAVDLLEEGDRVRCAAALHADPAKREVIDRLRGAHMLRPECERLAARGLATMGTHFNREVPREVLLQLTKPEFHDAVDALHIGSTLTVPLRSRGRTIGAFVIYRDAGEKPPSALDVPLFEELGRRIVLAIESSLAFERERMIATTFQQAALPARLPSAAGLTFDAFYHPAQHEAKVGGDWYDALKLGDGRIVISLGDVAGSGLGAAVIMSAMRQVIRGVAQVYPDPSAILDAADRTLKAEHPDCIVTALVGVLDTVARIFTYASAGHPSPFLLNDDGELHELAQRGLPLGLRSRDDAPAATVSLSDRAMLVFYTDGLIESSRNPLDGERRLREVLRRRRVLRAPHAARSIYEAMLQRGAHDDVVVLTLQCNFGAIPLADDNISAEIVRWQFDACDPKRASAVRRRVAAILRKHRVCHDDVVTAELVFSELIGNVVRYAPGEVEVVFDWTEAMPVLHVLDRGSGFELSPRLPTDMLSERGRGLFVIWSLAEDCNVTRRQGGGAHARVVLRHSRETGHGQAHNAVPTATSR